MTKDLQPGRFVQEAAGVRGLVRGLSAGSGPCKSRRMIVSEDDVLALSTLRVVSGVLSLVPVGRQGLVVLTSDKLFLEFLLVEFWQRFRGGVLAFPFGFIFAGCCSPPRSWSSVSREVEAWKGERGGSEDDSERSGTGWSAADREASRAVAVRPAGLTRRFASIVDESNPRMSSSLLLDHQQLTSARSHYAQSVRKIIDGFGRNV